ncbi:MAG TPA: glycosyltransferase [Gaiellaceae bacterium]|nr:glycosyltransferase [Gaiellaceae bacterium]
MAAPTFTIAMAARDAAATIDAAIRSVLAQTRPDFELVVVDDGSADGTAQVVERFLGDGRVSLVRTEHRGAAAARNEAVAAGSGRYVSMLDSDDLWLPTYLESMDATLRASPRAGLAYTDAWVLDDATRRFQRVTAMHYQDPPDPAPDDPAAFLAHLVERNFVFTSATVPRDVFEEAGGFDARLDACEDYELWLRIVSRGRRAVRAPGILAVYRRRRGSVSDDEERMLAAMARVLRLTAGDRLPPELRARADARAARLEAELAARRGARGVRPALVRARLRAVRAKEAALRPVLWRRTPPPAVRSAFGDLGASRAARTEDGGRG